MSDRGSPSAVAPTTGIVDSPPEQGGVPSQSALSQRSDAAGEEARRGGVMTVLADDRHPYSADEDALVEKGEQSIRDFLANDKKEKVRREPVWRSKL